MILIFAFILVSLMGCFLSKDRSIVDSVIRFNFVKSLVALSALIYFSTELLSFLNCLSRGGVLVFWGVTAVVTFVIAWKRNSDFLNRFIQRYQHFLSQKEYFFYVLMLACVPLSFTAIYVPPTKNEALSIHLPRVLHWISQGSIEHYVTMSNQQLSAPPFSDYILLHLKLLTGKNLFFNLAQFIYMLGSLMLVSLVSEKVFNNRRARNISVFFAFVIPIGLFQATTASDEWIMAFLGLASLYFIMEAYIQNGIQKIVLFSVSVGLTGLTHHAGWVFIFPLMLFFIILRLKKYGWGIWRYAPLFILIQALVLLPYLSRNVEIYKQPLGHLTQDKSLTSGITESIKNLFPNTVKNMASESASPIPRFNRWMENRVDELFYLLGTNSVRGNQQDNKFVVSYAFHEERASNFFHFILFLLSFIPLFFIKDRKIPLIYFLLLWSSFILFSSVFRWNFDQTNIKLLWYMMMIPFVGYVFAVSFKSLWWKVPVYGIMTIQAFAIIWMNPSKELIHIHHKDKDLPLFFSPYDLDKMNSKSTITQKLSSHLQKNDVLGLNFYLIDDVSNFNEKEKKEIVELLDFPQTKSMFCQRYDERLELSDMSLYHQVSYLSELIKQPSSNVGLSMLGNSNEYIILRYLHQLPNVQNIKNVAYPKSLSQLPSVNEPFEYQYLLTNNVFILDEIDTSQVKKIYDFAYFKLYEFKQAQNYKFELLDGNYDFSL